MLETRIPMEIPKERKPHHIKVEHICENNEESCEIEAEFIEDSSNADVFHNVFGNVRW